MGKDKIVWTCKSFIFSQSKTPAINGYKATVISFLLFIISIVRLLLIYMPNCPKLPETAKFKEALVLCLIICIFDITEHCLFLYDVLDRNMSAAVVATTLIIVHSKNKKPIKKRLVLKWIIFLVELRNC